MAKFKSLSNESSPLYVQMAEELRYNIHIEKWKPGTKIPSEIDLCKIYDVSRITMRRAIDELVRENLLVRERAKGTYVLDYTKENEEYFTMVKSFTKEMEELGKTATTLNAKVKKIKADRKLANLLRINIDDEVFCLMRTRGTEDSAFAYFVTYISYREDFSLDENDYYGSFYEYLATFGIRISQEREYIEAVVPSKEIQHILKIKNTDPILKRVRMTSQKEMDYYEYSECFYIGSRYRYYINFNA